MLVSLAKDVVNDFSLKVEPLWRLHKDNFKVLLEYCEILDKAALFNEVQKTSLGINPVSMEINISLEDIIVFSAVKDDAVYKVLKNASRFRAYKNSEKNTFNIALSFPSLWETVI